MATWVAGMTNPFVVKGDTIRSEREYTVKTGQAFKKGELIRIDTSGQIQIAALIDTTVVGACHGIAGGNAADYLTGGDYAGETIPVLLFTKDTVLGIQLEADKDQDNATIGVSYGVQRTEVPASSGNYYWTLDTDVTTGGYAQVESKPANDSWFDSEQAGDVTGGVPIYVRFTQATLDARSAA